jgi:tetratricopeptide (TPR) repeat protein
MSQAALELLAAAQQARKEHRLADAHRDLITAVSLCQQARARRELVAALKALGQIERDLGRADAAGSLYQEALALCREDGEPLAVAHTVRHLGDLHRGAGRMAEAESCYQEALALYRNHEQVQPLELANAIRPLALLKDATGRAAEARPLWEEAKALYAAADVPAAVTECSARLARQHSNP